MYFDLNWASSKPSALFPEADPVQNAAHRVGATLAESTTVRCSGEQWTEELTSKPAFALVKTSRGNQTRLELFGHEFDDWPAAIMQSMFDAA